jgi:ABC-2 type transport system permease protein
VAVYRRTYRGYAGPLTPTWSRFLILYRYAQRALFQSKFQTAFYVICFFFPLLCLISIYANGHLSVLATLGARDGLVNVNGEFFTVYLGTQGALSFILTAFIGPGLISRDLSNGALTLYLSRPLSRSEYVIGKMAALAITLSWITWVPGLVLFFVQSGVAGGSWMRDNFWIATGLTIGSLIWIFVLSLLALALSAWVKWRIAAGALLLAVFFFGAGFAQAINVIMGTTQGYLFDLASLVQVLWRDLLRQKGPQQIAPAEASVALLVFCGLCLMLLMKKVKPNEVVR